MAAKGKQTSETARAAPARRRRAILDRLKQEGPQDATTLAADLGVSAMAVRQHLYGLQEQGLAAYEEEARPLGRPVKLWRLTPAADAFFPDSHAELTLSLLAAMGEAFGNEGLARLLAVRTREQIAAYRQRIGQGRPLPERLRRLAELRSEEGYMAAVAPQEDGGYLLVENHCPICAAAAACSGLCASELTVFQAALGADATVERTDHILAGARRCAYRVRAKS